MVHRFYSANGKRRTSSKAAESRRSSDHLVNELLERRQLLLVYEIEHLHSGTEKSQVCAKESPEPRRGARLSLTVSMPHLRKRHEVLKARVEVRLRAQAADVLEV